MEQHRLGRDVFIALAAIAWADGQLDPDEADAIVRTAMEEGLELEEIGEIDAATKQKVELHTIDLHAMSKADRLFVYAVAAWMTRLDNKVTDAESAVLDQLGAALKIPDAPRKHADAIAKEIAEMAEGDRPDRYDLPALRRTIAERLEEAHQARLAMKEHEHEADQADAAAPEPRAETAAEDKPAAD
ncbi:MAG: DUF533 domain-containing protein [Polyangiaceae bacterium]